MTSTDLVRLRRRFVALTGLRWFPIGVLIPVMILLLRERGFDLATIGLLGAAYSITTVVLELPTGGLADVVGRRPVLAAAAVMSVLSFGIVAVGTDIWVLVFAFVISGIARALDSGPLQAWYVDAVHAVDPDADLRTGLARAGMAESLGLGVGALCGGALVAVSPFPASGGGLIALSTPYVLAAALGCLHLAAVLAWVHDPPRERPRGLRAVVADVPATIVTGSRLAAGRGPLRRIALLTVALGITLASIELLSPVSFAALLGGESAAAGPYSVLVTLAFLGTGAGAGLAPPVARLLRSSARGVLVCGLFAAVALAGVGAPTLVVAAAAYLTFYFLLGVCGPLVDGLTHDAVSSRQRATALSINSMMLQLGGVVASIGLGALAGAVSVAVALAVAAGCLAIGALTMVRMPAASDTHDPSGVGVAAPR